MGRAAARHRAAAPPSNGLLAERWCFRSRHAAPRKDRIERIAQVSFGDDAPRLAERLVAVVDPVPVSDLTLFVGQHAP